MAKPIPCSAASQRPKGQSARLAGAAVALDDSKKFILVYGYRPGDPPWWLYERFWILDPSTNTILDTDEQRWYLARDYPGIEIAAYSHAEAIWLFKETGRYGPWGDGEAAALLAKMPR